MFCRHHGEDTVLTTDAGVGEEMAALGSSLSVVAMAAYDSVPVIDLQERHPTVVRQIGRACEDWGMFQVVNHGVLLTAMLQQAKEFFLLPVEGKRKFSCTPNGTTAPHEPLLVQGYSSKEYGKCFLRWGEQLRHVTSPAHERKYELWPTNPPPYRETEEEYVAAQEKFVRHTMGLVSESLGLRNSAIADVFRDRYEHTLVANHYPPSQDQTVGLIEHSDFSIITVTLQDSQGLEVQGKDGSWKAVEPVPGALVVTLGDQIQLLSNGRYQSAVHRVTVDGERKRVSVNKFTNPMNDAVVAPISELVSEAEGPLYQEHSYGAYKAAFAGRWKEKRDFLKSGNPATFNPDSS